MSKRKKVALKKTEVGSLFSEVQPDAVLLSRFCRTSLITLLKLEDDESSIQPMPPSLISYSLRRKIDVHISSFRTVLVPSIDIYLEISRSNNCYYCCTQFSKHAAVYISSPSRGGFPRLHLVISLFCFARPVAFLSFSSAPPTTERDVSSKLFWLLNVWPVLVGCIRRILVQRSSP